MSRLFSNEAVGANALGHQRKVLPLHLVIVIGQMFISFACIGGGIVAICLNAKSETKFELLGAQLTTGHVGVALVGIGLIIDLFVIRIVLKNQRDLAALPPDRLRKLVEEVAAEAKTQKEERAAAAEMEKRLAAEYEKEQEEDRAAEAKLAKEKPPKSR